MDNTTHVELTPIKITYSFYINNSFDWVNSDNVTHLLLMDKQKFPKLKSCSCAILVVIITG